ncbi:hypothetical protein K443DRAFT_671094 [Laccaria amethystina LaAM-08-1]|uniref:Glucose receptor Git3 N-terminal domain-containing protein n=1 Tax=Laccaria amethystina LaAM-08-1 TaxID=1095629 RepID=A0A0C9XBZ2_9AGAR|nr:hypothetical protein K443DRAFT_671094 [Laccaria amethystina LaAM-08-1]
MDTAIPTRSGIICTPEEYAATLNGSSLDHCLTRADSIGLTLASQAGLLSLVAVVFVFVIIIRNAIYRSRRTSTRKWHIFQEPMDILMLSLFIADALQAIGAVMDLKWVGAGQVNIGQFCSAQGIISQLGEVNVAITTLLIALYTFIGVWMGRGIRSNKITGAVVGIVWVLVALLVLLGAVLNRGFGKGYERPTPFWCWIGEPYLKWRILGEYVWFWMTLLVSIATYIPLYLWSRGNINFDNASWWKFTIQRADHSEGLRGIRRRSLIMLLYPGIYCCLILPLSVVRWIGFVQERGGHSNHVPPAATFASITIFGLSGACNAILLLTTRPESGLFSRLNRDDMGFAPSSPPLQPKEFADSGSNINADEELELGRLPSR